MGVILKKNLFQSKIYFSKRLFNLINCTKSLQYIIQYMEEDIQNYSSTVMFRWTPCICMLHGRSLHIQKSFHPPTLFSLQYLYSFHPPTLFHSLFFLTFKWETFIWIRYIKYDFIHAYWHCNSSWFEISWRLLRS